MHDIEINTSFRLLVSFGNEYTASMGSIGRQACPNIIWHWTSKIVASELIPNYILHCISLHWVSVLLPLLLNHLRFQFSKRLVSKLDIIKPMVISQHLLDCSKHLWFDDQAGLSNKCISDHSFKKKFSHGANSFSSLGLIFMTAIRLGLSIG